MMHFTRIHLYSLVRQERHEVMQSFEDEINALMDKRREREETYMEARRRRVDEDQRQLEAQRVQASSSAALRSCSSAVVLWCCSAVVL